MSSTEEEASTTESESMADDSEAKRAVAVRRSKRRKHKIGVVTEDGSIIPHKRPRIGPDGLYVRPRGRCPIGMGWNAKRGIWIPYDALGFYSDSESSELAAAIEASLADQQAARKNQQQHQQQQQQQQSSKPAASSRKKPPSKDENVGDQFHPASKWQEPPRDDQLTLYDFHRKPRPVFTGRIQVPLKALDHEFRCVICLGYVRQTRMVMECLHRFCEDCIEKSLRLGKNECPICRVFVPSRRNLAPDPNFDHLIQSILGARAEDDEYEGEHARNVAEAQANLQQAIHLKRRARRRRSDEGDNFEGVGRMTPPSQEHSQRPSMPSAAPPLVEVKLQRHGFEKEADELEFPFLRLSGGAAVQVLKRFLQKKLSKPEADFHIMILHEGRLEVLRDSMKLSTIAKKKPKDARYVTLWYLIKEVPHY